MSTHSMIDLAGWVGAVTILAAYALVSTKRLQGDAVRFQLMNLVGALLLVINTFYYGAYPSSGLNIVWIGIAAFALAKKGFTARGD